MGLDDPSPKSFPALTDEEKSIRKQGGENLAHQIQPEGSSMFMKNQSHLTHLFPFQMMFLVEKVKESHQTWDIWFPDPSDKTHQSVLLGKLERLGPDECTAWTVCN